MEYIYALSGALTLSVLMFAYLVKAGYFVLKAEERNFSEEPQEKIAVPGADKDDDTSSEPSETESNVTEELAEEKSDEGKKEQVGSYDRKTSFALTGIFFVISVILNVLLYKHTVTNNQDPVPFLFVKMMITHGIVAAAALTDYKRSKIPNRIIVFGLIARAIVYIFEFIFNYDNIGFTLKNDALGLLIGFGVLFIIAVIARGALGFGDVKLFGIIGIMAGSGGVFVILYLTLLVNSITAIGLILAKKKTFKSKMPMAPFIYCGFLLTSVLGIF